MSRQSKNSDAGFLMQGSILAMASIISRIVGLIYRIPLTSIIGKQGNDYYGTAYEVYNIILLISCYSLPLAVSKLVSARVSAGYYRNASKVLKGALGFAFVSGTIAMAIVFFGADFFCGTLLKTPHAAIALKVLAPVLLIVAVLGVFRGFFQGLNTMVPSAISQVLEQIVNAVISVLAAYYLFSYGSKVGAILNDESGYSAAFGAAGGTLGTASGALFALVFMFLAFLLYYHSFNKRVRTDYHRDRESIFGVLKVLIATIIPVLLSTTIYNISAIIDQGIYKNIANLQGYSAWDISIAWGTYTGQVKVLINVPIAIASAMAASVVPSLTASKANKNASSVKKKIVLAQRFIMVIAIPCFFGFIVLAGPIMKLLFNDDAVLSANLLKASAVSIVFYSLSTLSNGILQGIDKFAIPVRNALIALVAHIFVLIILMEAFRLGIYSVIIANAFYALLMCVLNNISVRRYSGAKLGIEKGIVIPTISGAIMAVVVLGLYKLMDFAALGNMVSVAVSIALGALVYFIILIKLRGISPKELQSMPMGTRLYRVAIRLHLMHEER